MASSPTGIDCGSTCEAQFDQGTPVTLTATPESGWTFAYWSGCDSMNGNECDVLMGADEHVTATFSFVDSTTHALSVQRVGPGAGRVTSAPAGIDCGDVCSSQFADNAAVVLTAAPADGMTPATWSGCDSVNAQDQCVVGMGADRQVATTFPLATTATTTTSSGSSQINPFPSFTTVATTPGAVTFTPSADLLNALHALVAPVGPQTSAKRIEKAGGWSKTVTLSAGTLWIGIGTGAGPAPPAGAGAVHAAIAKSVLVAQVKKVFAQAGKHTVVVKLTPAGRKLLRHGNGLKLTSKLVFTPAGGAPVTAKKSFRLRR